MVLYVSILAVIFAMVGIKFNVTELSGIRLKLGIDFGNNVDY